MTAIHSGDSAVDTYSDTECPCGLSQHIDVIEGHLDILDERIAAIRDTTNRPYLWDDPADGCYAIRSLYATLTRRPVMPEYDECDCDADQWCDRLLYLIERRRHQLVRIWKIITQPDTWVDPSDGIGMVRAITLEGGPRPIPIRTVSPHPAYL
ncbi:hypothetical protein [Gordonia otitidis]|uniref:Uncharacterized protein n=1 Tax=Gordonia otitidis (strain DSM 44809 / CCUG 52243 / JCM 12355 / NBRC 100426 / IFM 10032) TaxID=1108044 RepID=H5TK23_GORO1|nr:hypothetical protein [Gordonia otitidis]GAB33831.1 hypothetical protein GOOTI_083_00060 [Gordonia otitidis NBRC 100426]